MRSETYLLLKNCSRWKEAKETWQLNVMRVSGFSFAIQDINGTMEKSGKISSGDYWVNTNFRSSENRTLGTRENAFVILREHTELFRNKERACLQVLSNSLEKETEKREGKHKMLAFGESYRRVGFGELFVNSCNFPTRPKLCLNNKIERLASFSWKIRRDLVHSTHLCETQSSVQDAGIPL